MDVVGYSELMKQISYKDINNLLANTQDESIQKRLIKIIKFRIGTPYKKYPFKKEENNQLPFFPLRYSDCVSFVLTSIALALSKNISEAKQKMIKIRYTFFIKFI